MSTNNIDELRKIIANSPKDSNFVFDKSTIAKESLSAIIELLYQVKPRRLDDLATIIEQADKIKALTTFVDWVLDAVVSGSDICGGDAQDKMYELGILTREIYNPEIHTLQQGSECEAGDYIYFKAGDS